MARLPQELLEKVIDFVATDESSHPASLYACCLVCKDFVPRARKHLFHEVTLTRNTITEGRFLVLLVTSPGIGKFVRKFSLIGVEPFEDRPRINFDGMLPTLTKALVNVEDLHLFRINVGPNNLKDFARLNSVTSLDLSLVHFSDTQVAQKLLTSYPLLRKVSGLQDPDETTDPDPSIPPPPLLEKIIFSSDTTCFVSWFALWAAELPLRYIHYSIIYNSTTLHKLLSACCNTLEALSWFIYDCPDSLQKYPYNFSSMVQLREISLTNLLIPRNAVLENLDWFSSVIVQVKSEHLHKIIIYQQLPDWIDLETSTRIVEDTDWLKLLQILNGFNDLFKLYIALTDPPYHNFPEVIAHMKNLISDKVHQAIERGVLQLGSPYDENSCRSGLSLSFLCLTIWR